MPTGTCLDQVGLVRFTTNRNEIRVGEGASLSWEVSIPQGCNVTLHLNETRVSNSSTLTVRPLRSVIYRLVARLNLNFKQLGTIQISVDNNECQQVEISESVLAPLLRPVINTSLEEFNKDHSNIDARKRRETQVEIEPSGVIVRIRLKLAIDNFVDPTLDIDAKIDLRTTAEGRPRAFYRSFAVDFDFPWWFTVITAGLSKLLEEVGDELIEGELKPRILAELNGAVENLSGGGNVGAIETEQDRLLVTVCPNN